MRRFSFQREQQNQGLKGRRLSRKQTMNIIHMLDQSIQKKSSQPAILKRNKFDENTLNSLALIKQVLVHRQKQKDEVIFTYIIFQQKHIFENFSKDPLMTQSPSFFFSIHQPTHPKTERIHFNSYINGELSLNEYIQLNNFERLYSLIKVDQDGRKTFRELPNSGPDTFSKLKQQICQKYKYGPQLESRNLLELTSKRDQNKEKKVDPKVNLANKIRSLILQKHGNFNIADLQQNKLQKKIIFLFVKLMRSLNEINDNYLEKISNKDLLCSAFGEQYYKKENASYVKGSTISLMKSRQVRQANPKKENFQIFKRNFNQNLNNQVEEYLQHRQQKIEKENVQSKSQQVKMKKFSDFQASRTRIGTPKQLSNAQFGSMIKSDDSQPTVASSRYIQTQKSQKKYKKGQLQITRQFYQRKITLNSYVQSEKPIRLTTFFSKKKMDLLTEQSKKNTDGNTINSFNSPKIEIDDENQIKKKPIKKEKKITLLKLSNKDVNCELLHSNNGSQDSSFQSLFEIGIDDLYGQSLQLQKQMLSKESEAFVKRIRQIQRIQQLNDQINKANAHKLSKIE